jgi:glycerol kinase
VSLSPPAQCYASFVRLLALDEGTTTARAALYDDRGCRLQMDSRPLRCQFPHPGWVEQDPLDIWNAQLDAARDLPLDDVAALGITNQRETTIVWERATGLPVAPAIVWQCRRTAPFCAQLAASSDAAEITRRTGLVIDAYFSASKIRWVLDNLPGARRQDLLFGNVDTWLIWNLTNGRLHATDPSNASRTMLMNLDTGDWDDELLRLFEIPREMLPHIVPSCAVIGETDPSLFGRPILIAGIAGDQQAALVGQACFRAGLTKNTYGTGCFALMHTGSRRPVSRHRLLATRAAATGATPEFAIEGSVFIGGAVVQFLRDQLGLVHSASQTAELAASVPDTGGVYFVPAFVGLGAPYWDAAARGLICGLTRATSRAHFVRAALESIAWQTRELVDAMQADSGERLEELRVDGGAARNDFLMQFQADILGCRVVRPADTETTALGAAYLAGLAAGLWTSTAQLESFWRADSPFEPSMPLARREELFAEWKQAVRRARC